MTEEKKTLYYLSELSDYKISSKDPDVRGWDVKDSDNRVIGKVENLLVNKHREKVVYLDVEVDETIIEANHDPYGTPANAEVHEFINKEGENHIIIPIGLVGLNEDQKFVYTDRIDHQTFAETKRKRRDIPVERDYEVVVLESYDRFGDPDSMKQEREGTTAYKDKPKTDFETKPDDSYDEDYKSEKTRRMKDDGTYESRRRKGNIPDDDSFYDRPEFDSTNYRRRK